MRYTLLTLLLVFSFAARQLHAQFTIIDSLPVGAYGAAGWGDFNKDGLKDLAYITQSTPDIFKVYQNKGDHFEATEQQFGPMYNASLRWGDFNQDGLEDIVVNGLDQLLNTRTYIFASRGDGTFDTIPNSIFPLSFGSIDLADYNLDGMIDIALAGFDSLGSSHTCIYRNQGGFQFEDIHAGLDGIHFGELKWGDFNLDGLPDLLVNGLNFEKQRVLIYQNLGNDQFELLPGYMNNSGGTADWLDYDLDSYPDILITGYDDTTSLSFTSLHHNNGDGTFSLVDLGLPEFGEPSGVAIGHFNLDAYPDICFIGGSMLQQNWALAYGNGEENFILESPFVIDYLNYVAETADIDGDGDDDLLLNYLILRNDAQSTGVVKQAEKTSFRFSPNPASGILRIDKPEESHGQIFDFSGRIIERLSMAKGITEIDVSAWPQGIYLIHLQALGSKAANSAFFVKN